MTVDTGQAGRLAVDLSRVVKLLRALNATSPRFHDRVEVSAYPLLFAVHEEPARVTALAERVHTDVSVVSRQVRHLETLGLVAKAPDPDDGRASLVALTPEGDDLVTRVVDGRGRWLAGILDGWTPDQAESFHLHLDHFADSLRAELDARTTTQETQ
jgi:DNA-binding MarR family transcriptional regulator